MSLINLQTSDVAVFGLGLSGISTIAWLSKNHIVTRCCDDDLQLKSKSESLGSIWTPLSEGLLDNASFLVLSPGIPFSHKVAIEAQKKNIPIICDVEIFAQKYEQAQIIAITGTNGKSTLTHLISHILNSIGIKAVSAGNYGTPILDIDMSQNPVVVLELSSYQLERSPSISPSTSIITNLTPDHLDRYNGSFAEYQKAKLHLFEQTKESGLIVFDEGISELPLVVDVLKLRKDDTLQLKLTAPVSLSNGGYAVNIAPDLSVYTDNSSTLGGLYGAKLLNFALASIASVNPSYFLDIKNNLSSLQDAVDSFIPLAHRQETVFKNDNLLVINDSKATNPEASVAALERLDNIFWIAGGLDKNTSLLPISPYLDKIKHAYLFGQASSRIENFLKSHAIPMKIEKISMCESLEEATARATCDALQDKDFSTVLLSPLCASFDQFDNFAQRGNVFKRVILSKLNHT